MPPTATDYREHCQTILPVRAINLKRYALLPWWKLFSTPGSWNQATPLTVQLQGTSYRASETSLVTHSVSPEKVNRYT